MPTLPKYTENKKKGNIGESFVKFILSSFCLVHKIDGDNDIGNDFICELIKGEYPTNVLFYVQVKYWDEEPRDSQLKKTIEYWKESEIPVYLFWVKNGKFPESEKDIKIDTVIPGLKYKRYTPISHNPKDSEEMIFKNFNKKIFLRDLMVDYARCLYYRGLTTVIRKDHFFETQKGDINLGDNCLFVGDMIPGEYAENIINNSWTNVLASAVILYMSENKKTLELARNAIYLAEELFGYSLDAFKYYPGWSRKIKLLKKEIEEKLNNIKNKYEK